MMTDAHQLIIERALQTTFGAATYDEATPVTGGMSGALILRVVVNGAPYLVRMGGSPHADAETEMAAVCNAAKAGIAPKVHHANVEDRVMITDFIAHRPYTPDASAQIAALIARVQTLPPNGRAIHQIDITSGMIARGRAAGSTDAFEDVLTRFEQVAKVYPRDELVPCHNDVKAPNVLFDGARPWIVDWEAAFANDRYVDLAYSAHFFCTDEDAYLAAFLGRTPDDIARARFFLMRFVVSVSYVAFVGVPAGREYLEAARLAIASPRFAESVARVS
jgi:thiamine kinase-like enzyme